MMLPRMNDHELARLLTDLEPRGRDLLRRLMRAEQSERDEFASALLRHGTDVSWDLMDLLDLAAIHPEVRRQVSRVLGHLDASS
jgi:hypothetical protein